MLEKIIFIVLALSQKNEFEKWPLIILVQCMVLCKIHYENTPIQCTVIFHGCKNDYFQMKNCDIFLTLTRYGNASVQLVASFHEIRMTAKNIQLPTSKLLSYHLSIRL